jgi:hypothetical protein
MIKDILNNRKQLIITAVISLLALVILGLGPAMVIVTLQAIAFSLMVIAGLLVLPSLKEEWEYMGSIDWRRTALQLVEEEPLTPEQEAEIKRLVEKDRDSDLPLEQLAESLDIKE